MRFGDIVNEVRILGNNTQPLKDDETIRLYHGTNDTEFLNTLFKHGGTGDKKIFRIYSYENNNNPRGIFVTPELNTAKNFGDYIIEFHAKISDLEAPLWPAGGFTVQGGYSEYWNDEKERQEALKQARMNASKYNNHISQSDRPELAKTLMDFGEKQALFTGDLNRNSIRAIWVKDKPELATSSYTRMSIRDFINKAEIGEIKTRYGSNIDTIKTLKGTNLKLVQPRETVTIDLIIERLANKYAHFSDREEIERIITDALSNKDKHQFIKNMVWSDRQFEELLRDFEN